jgi:hypothetical protein
MEDPPVDALTNPAASALSAVVRRERSEHDLAHLTLAIDRWFNRRRASTTGQYGTTSFADLHKTRLDALERVLRGGLATLESELEKVDVSAGRTLANVNADCRVIDQAVVWMHRAWTYYREKFDQRDDPELKATLAAADEVVWSCYKWVYLFGRLPPEVRIGPAPLAYVESEFSPAIWAAGRPAPENLRDKSGVEGLDAWLATLPIPLLRLPPWSVDAPWWLVFVAHEIGHNLQRELGLVQPFRSALKSAWPASAGNASDRQDRWILWDAEIFADLVSVALVGPWAIAALRELLIAPATEMASDTGVYPPAIVRLTLMARAADRLGMDGAATIAGIDPDAATANEVVIADMADIDRVLDAALGPLTATGAKLEDMCALESVKDELSTQSKLMAHDLGRGPVEPEPHLLTPRYVLGGTFLAWQRVSEVPDIAKRAGALDALAANASEAISKSGPSDTRAGSDPGPLAAHGESFATWLLAQSRATRADEPAP